MQKIAQTDNFNSNSDLYIKDSQVYKIYNENNKKTAYNLDVVKNIFKHYDDLSKINELVLPNKWLTRNNKIVGFSMDYIKGYTLSDILENNLLSKDEIKELFKKILNVINKFKKLQFDFCLGDLHEKNVIVDKDKNIHIIDPDGFIINNKKYYNNDCISLGKYSNIHFNPYERAYVKVNGDYVCLLYMILLYIFKDVNVYDNNLLNYLNYLIDDNHLLSLVNRSKTDINFRLSNDDIEYIFNKNFAIKKDETDYQEIIERELLRIRSI